MPGITQVLVILLCAVSIVLVVYLVFMVVRLMRMVDSIQTRIDKEVSPLLLETTETVSKVNGIISKVSNSLDWLSSFSHAAEDKPAAEKSDNPAQRFVSKLGKSAAVWLAGMIRAKAIMKKKKLDN